MYSHKSSRLSTLTNANNSLPSFQAAFVLTLNVFKCASSCNLINKQFYQLLTWPFRILLISSQSSFSASIHMSWLTPDEIYPWYDHYVPLFFTFSWKDMFWTANWFHMTPYWWGFTFNLYNVLREFNPQNGQHQKKHVHTLWPLGHTLDWH